ncbi:MAG: hypothetical protein AAGF79_07265 [Pseudomonadota bacterium]
MTPSPSQAQWYAGLEDSIRDWLREAIEGLDAPNANLSNIFNDLLEKLGPNDIPTEIRNILEHGSGLAVAQATLGVACIGDRVSERAKDVLRDLEDWIFDGEGDLPPPVICQIIPPTIRLNDGPSTWGTVQIFGYGMGRSDDDGQRFQYYIDAKAQAPVRAATVSKYQAVLDLTAPAMREALFNAQNRTIDLFWNGRRVSDQGQIIVTAWIPPRVTDTVAASTLGYRVPGCAGPSRCKDNQFNNDDGPARVRFNATPTNTGGREIGILVNEFYAREIEDDNTMVREIGGPYHRLYVAPPGFRIASFSPAISGGLNRVIPEDASRNRTWSFRFPGGHLIERFDVKLSRSGGREAGEYTSYRFRHRQIDVVLQQTRPDWLD